MRIPERLAPVVLLGGVVVGCGDNIVPLGPSPEVLVSLQADLTSLVLSPTDVYVSQRRHDDGIAVFSAPKTGGAVRSIYDAGVSHSIQLVGVDAESVFWIEYDDLDGTLRAADLASGEVRFIAGRPGLVNAALDATHVYIASDDSDPKQVVIERIEKAGGSPQRIGRVPTRVMGLVIDDDHVLGINGSSEAIWRLAKTGGIAEDLATEVDCYADSSDVRTVAFVADNEHLYYYSRRNGITRVSKATGEQQAFGHGACGADALAVDATDVFWGCDDRVSRADKTGDSPITFIEARTDGRVAVDATHLYWTASDGVMVLEK